MKPGATDLSRERTTEASWPKLNGINRLHSMQSDTFDVPPYVAFDVSDWVADPDRVLSQLHAGQLGTTVVVRSCAALEDKAHDEPPGFFDSVLDVALAETAALKEAIDKVCASYRRRKRHSPFPHKVIVQTQLLDPIASGVGRFGGNPTDYIEIDIDNDPMRTDAVTSGQSAERLYLSSCIERLPKPWRQLRQAFDVLRGRFAAPFFVEFAIDARGHPAFFQVRTDRRDLVDPPRRSPSCSELKRAARYVQAIGPLSVMADWNPAEMLGRNPRPLDLSLYNELLMSEAWMEGRTSLGWRMPGEKQLMVQLGSRPFVRLRLSLESLLPQCLKDSVAHAIVEDRLQLLAEQPDLHDKVEFRVMWSAFAFDEAAVRSELVDRGICNHDVDQLFKALKRVTKDTVCNATHYLVEDRAKKRKLQRSRRRLLAVSAQRTPHFAAEELNKAIAVCRNCGTVPFSRQARIAFSFRFMINHLIADGWTDEEHVRRWESGLSTVAWELSRDLSRVATGQMARSSFDQRYGHLRPRTYSIESQRYDERPELGASPKLVKRRPALPPPDCDHLGELLDSLGIDISQSEFWGRAASAFRARETFKFAFTALLSDILRLLSDIAVWSGIDRSELSELPIEAVISLLTNSADWTDFGLLVRRHLDERVAEPDWPLPEVIFDAEELHVVKEILSRPSFIGSGLAQASIRSISSRSDFDRSLRNKIVAIESPDPGFDWIFSQQIAGLITAYGGEFSHMGVRCAEFGVPAVLGCGRQLFDAIVSAKSVTMDVDSGQLGCGSQRLYPT